MNEETQSIEAPRRSGRERKQVVSVYAEAKIEAKKAAGRKKKVATAKNDSGQRSTRSRRAARADESDEEICDEKEDDASSDDESATSSDDEDDQALSDCEVADSSRPAKPTVHRRYYWTSGDRRAGENNSFESVDGTKMFYNRGHGNYLKRQTGTVLSKGQKSLIAKQEDEHIIVEPKFSKSSGLTQVPYHVEMLPCYEYFADGIKHNPAMESLKITNHNLPPSPWLENSILSVLKVFSNEHGRMSLLELSNCSLSDDDISSLTKFLDRNKTITSLNISRNNITSADSVKALAKAIKKHPVLCNVNLAHVFLAGGSAVVNKMLLSCKTCVSLQIGHKDFDKESVAAIAKFLGKKNSLTSFSLVGTAVDNDNKTLLSEAIAKNKTIQKLRLHSNKLQLPGIIRNTKKITAGLSKLTHLDLSHNSLPVAGVKVLAKFLEADCNLVSLIMSSNHLTTKGASVLLPALKKNTSLQHLDLSSNWLNDGIAPLMVDLLGSNRTLRSIDLIGNKSLTKLREERRRYSWYANRSWTIPRREGGRYAIVKGALFDTTSLDSIVSSNHTCALKMSGYDNGDSKSYNKRQHFEETVYKINALDASEGKKIRFKVVLALNEVDKALYNPRSFDKVPLEMMPHLLEMLQQRIGFNGFGKDVAPEGMNMDTNSGSSTYRRWGKWNPLTRKCEMMAKKKKAIESLSRVYEVIMSWQSLPQLFVRGPGELPESTNVEVEEAPTKKKKSKSKSRKRKKFGDAGDDDDEAWIPKGGRKRGKWERNSETMKWDLPAADKK